MSGEFVDLLTKIVLLAIALIGLYKAAKYRSRSESSEGATPTVKKSDGDGVWALFMEFAGYFALILIPLAFMFLFQFSIRKLTELNETEPSPIQNVPELQLSSDPSDLEIMLAAAVRVRNSASKGNQLTDLVTLALEEGDFEIAIRAASAIPNSATSDRQLKRIMEAIPERDRPTAIDHEEETETAE